MQLPYDETHTRRRIYLVRHGHAIGQGANSARYTPDVTLTPQGTRQAEAARDFLSQVPFDEAWSSDMTRAQQTAGIILQAHPGLALQTSPAYREIGIDLAQAVAHGQGGLNERLHAFAYQLWHADEPGARIFGVGDFYREYADRAFETMNALALDATGHTVLLATHGGFIRAAMCWATRSASLSAFGAFDQDHCGITVLDVDIDAASRRVLRHHVRLANFTALDPDKRNLRRIDSEVMAEQISALVDRLKGSSPDA
ncbi:MAG: phosphoglycerate mutase [Panacagrimonas sp.]|jgi:broad specificity phosphatase PhoE|nr:histidine phosphatase family protein [Panacagrimonas sp.]MCC2657531.1 phosphoglycerate mutase [Panacagrimonas sp.]